MEAVKWGEHLTWGPPPRMGGGFTDRRDEATAQPDLERYEGELFRLSELSMAGENVADERAYVGRLIDWTKRRLAQIADQRAAAERQAIADAQMAEARARLGLPPIAPQLTPEQMRDEQHRAELARLAAQPRLTKQELDDLDPFSAAGKARALAELNRRDPFRKGAQPVDAMDVYAGRVDDPAHPRR